LVIKKIVYPEEIVAAVVANLLDSGAQVIKHLKIGRLDFMSQLFLKLSGKITYRLVHFIH
jgi:predicted regulator of Ras-like GTPase activity (Roadblock/LC7/MglB family)